MSTRELSPRPSLEQYKKQAKDLLKKFRAGDDGARARVIQYHPRVEKRARASAPTAIVLADAQWVIAREHGFESWPKFAAHVESAIAGTDGTDAASVRATRLAMTTTEINLCVFMQGGTRAVTSAEGGPVQLWDVQSGQSLRAFDAGGVNVWGLTAIEDGRVVLIGGRDGAVRVFDAGSGKVLRVLSGHHSLVRCVAVSPDVRVALSADMRDPRMRFWDIETERCLRILDGHTDALYDVAFDRKQRRALSGSRDTTVRLWDLEDGRCLRAFEGHTYHVHSVAWSDDEKRALSCAQEVRLWDLESGQCLRTFRGHTQVIRSVAWSPDQRRAVSASHDATVRVWDVESGTCVHVLEGHEVGVVKASWSVDGGRIHSCDWNGNIRTWTLPSDRVTR